ncbi:hypothetical protein [Deminuibacter soli]|nr:hypothetical protein [Deminuibacter soli]
MDSAKHLLDTAVANIKSDVPVSIFYTDSLGYFSHYVAADAFTRQDKKIGLRIINLSPFDQPVFLTFNQRAIDSLPDEIRYLQHTGFVPVNMATDSLLNIKAYQQGDSLDILAATQLRVYPGHAYTILLSGYTSNNPGSYTDPLTGRLVFLQTTYAIKVFQNF